MMALLRLSEPFVFKELIDIFSGCCSSKRKTENKIVKAEKWQLQFAEQSLCQFMNSSVNIEYVYLILLGVKTYYVELNTSEQDDNSQNFKLNSMVVKQSELYTQIKL